MFLYIGLCAYNCILCFDFAFINIHVFCLKCVGHELCYYYVNDVIVRVFNLNC